MLLSHFPVLCSERLKLRRFDDTDFNAYFSLHQDPTVYPFITDKGPLDLSRIRQKIQQNRDSYLEGNHIYWAIALLGSNQFVGYVAAHNLSDIAILSYAILPEHQRQGIMKEALQEVIRFLFSNDLSSIEARTHFENKASAALLNSLGFKRTQDKKERLVFKLSVPRTR